MNSPNSMSTHDNVFIFTDKTPPPEDFFQGYCFEGTDYIFGDDGAQQYTSATGRKLRSGLDGCYVLVSKEGAAYRFSTDYSGYRMLYYFHDGGSWAVSNSFARVVDYIRDIGKPIVPNYAQLSAILSPGSAASQLFSFDTTLRGVYLLPRGVDLIVRSNGISFESWGRVAKVPYQDALSEHLDLWSGRMETFLTNADIGLTTDLTGGVDSRTTFAMIAFAKRRLGETYNPPRFNCGSTPSNFSDLDVALQIGEKYDFEINDERRFPAYNLTAEESIRTFRDLNVGVSFTLYLPVEGPTPFKISIGGGGGEIHRSFYQGHIRSKDPDLFIDSYASRLPFDWLKYEFSESGHRALNDSVNELSDPLRVHYREFRHRFHSGRSPRYGVSFTPLDSVTADRTQSQAGEKRLDLGLFNYDIINSLDAELLDMPYDSVSKAPSDEVRRLLSNVDVSDVPRPGRVWASVPSSRRIKRDSRARFLELETAVKRAAEDSFVLDFWGPDVLKESESLLERMLSGEGIGNAVNGKPITALLSAALVSPSV